MRGFGLQRQRPVADQLRIAAVLLRKIGRWMPQYALRYLIKSYVDTNIAHYDRSTEETKQIVTFCNSVFGKEGKFPIDQFVGIMESYMMSLVIEMWFYAGELGADIGNPDPAVAVFMDVNRQELLEMMKEKFNDKE